jgi:exosortase
MTNLMKHLTGVALLLMVTTLLGWRPIVDTLSLATRDDQYTYIFLILPVSIALIFLEWRSLRTIFALGLLAGVALLSLAALTACTAFVLSPSLNPDARLSINMIALVLSWIGGFVFCFGYRASRSVTFPLFFLFGLVPLPTVILNTVVAFLQQASAWAAHMFFSAFGVPVVQDGVILTIPRLTLQVAEECSSIRSSSMLLVTTMVLAQLLLRSPWRKALLIFLAVPLSVAKNGLRIFTIAMLGTRVDQRFLTGKLHRNGGIVFFTIALLATFGLLWILRRGEAAFHPQTVDAAEASSTVH